MNIKSRGRWAVLLLVPCCVIQAAVGVERDLKSVASDTNAFALDLYGQIAGEASGNLFFSPTSIGTALAMAYAGARGETAEEMRAVLHLSLEDEALHRAVGDFARAIGSEREGLTIAVANALWGQSGYPFRPEYLALGERRYGASLRALDFRQATEQSRITINEWVEGETAGKIRDLFEPGSLDPMTRLVLTNAIYFKGTWLRQFDPKMTRKAPFHPTPARSVQVDMMHTREVRLGYVETPELQALELPYSEHAASMILLLPAAGRSLEALEKALTPDKLEGILAEMRHVEMSLVAIPRFTMTCSYSLSNELSRLGMRLAFTPNADFSGIATAEDLFISEVVHKAFVEVNEEGTEAAAATGTLIRATSAQPSHTFRADRPFVFLIRDEATGAILFLGRVVEPSGNA